MTKKKKPEEEAPEPSGVDIGGVELGEEELERMLPLYRDKKLPRKEWDALFTLLDGIPDVKALVISPPFNFSAKDYSRLRAARSRGGHLAALKQPGKVLLKEESTDYAQWLKEGWDDLKMVGKTVVMKYRDRASEMSGYYEEDPAKPGDGRVNMVRFVDDACKFYSEVAPRIEEIEQENLALTAMLQMMAIIYGRSVNALTTLKITLDQIEMANPEFALELIPLKAQLPDELRGMATGL